MTGIPNAQPRHALIMARFADECLHALQEVTQQLAEKFGEDTTDLQVRVGMHSGATTAGVIRADKGRFQLFVSTPSSRFSHIRSAFTNISVILL